MLNIKKRIKKNQQLKYKEYGFFESGQTKESRVDFDTLISSLNKINTDLISLSITVEKLKHTLTEKHRMGVRTLTEKHRMGVRPN